MAAAGDSLSEMKANCDYATLRPWLVAVRQEIYRADQMQAMALRNKDTRCCQRCVLFADTDVLHLQSLKQCGMSISCLPYRSIRLYIAAEVYQM